MEKGMAIHSSILAWRIPWTEEPGGLQSMGSQRVRQKESYDQPRQYIKKQRHYFGNKVHLVKAMVLPIVMYGCENWTIKKAEHWRIDAFKLWCWRRLLKVPWTAKRSNQSILKEIRPEYSLEGLMLKLKLKVEYTGHLMWKTDSLEKTMMLGKIEGGRKG